MNTGFQYLKIPYGENVLAMLGCEQIHLNENKTEKIQLHFHNLMEIGICRMGTGEIMIDEKTYQYAKDDIIVIPRNFSHAIISRPGERSFWESIYIKPAAFLEKVYKTEERKRENIINAVEYRPFFKPKGTANELRSEINLIMDKCRKLEYGYKNCINGLLYALYMEIIKINHQDYQKPEYGAKAVTRRVETIGAALEYIEENFAQDLRMSDIAKAVYVSETYLRRLFLECCAMSPMQYVKLIKVENACEMLRIKNLSINEAAYKVGYTNMTTFINNFKKITGMTPKQWREKYRKI